MKRIFPILLIGVLSMLFAEVYSGASQAWFIDGWGLLVTYPLYLTHLLFFLWLSLKWKKVSLVQLYFFGVLFALYESWITKVLWAGYIDAAGPGIGTILGLAIPEFPILVFFWHPVMSFIIPILVYEVLTRKGLSEHTTVLQKTRWKLILITIGSIVFGSFIAKGNQYSPISANLSLFGTFLLVVLTYLPSKKYDLRVFEFGKWGFVAVTIYLLLLYAVTFFFILPEKIPQTILPYLAIICFYGFVFALIIKSPRGQVELIELKENTFGRRDLLIFAAITTAAVNIGCLLPTVNRFVLAGTYFLLAGIGMILFLISSIGIVRQILSRKGSDDQILTEIE